MKKIVRWHGVIAFIVIVGVLAVFWLCFVDNIVKRVIERNGTAAVGAKVEIADLDVSIVPAGISMVDLRVADPDRPMTNIVEIGRLSVSIDSGNLLRRKLVIDDMVADGVMFGTARKTSGAIAENHKKAAAEKQNRNKGKKQGPSFELPSFTLPSPEEILKKEELESVKRTKKLKEDIQTEQKRWKERLATLPDKKKFEQYKARLEKIKSKARGLSGMLGAAEDASSVYRDIKADIETIKKARADFNRTINDFKARIAKLSKLPEQDVKRLTDKYANPSGAVSNISRLVFGEKINRWIETFRTWYHRLSPYLAKVPGPVEPGRKVKLKPARGEGVDVRFREANPMPDFIVRRAEANVILDLGTVEGQAKNITLEQNIIGSPATVEFKGSRLKKAGSVYMKVVANYIVPQSPVYTMDLSVRKYLVNDMDLSANGKFPLHLASAVADLAANGRMDNSGLNLSGLLKLNNVRMSLDADRTVSPIMEGIGSALAGIDSLDVTATVVGPPDNVRIDVASNLDSIFRQAVSKALAKQAAQLEEKLRAAVFERADMEIGGVKSSLDSMGGIDKDLLNRSRLGESLLR